MIANRDGRNPVYPKMRTKLQGREDTLIDLEIFKPVLRAYALGYASSIIPRLLGWVRLLRRKDKTVQEKLDVVCPSRAHLLSIFQFTLVRYQPNHFTVEGIENCALL